MPQIKYVLLPGPIKSKADGDIHHIGVNQLRRLYGLRNGEFIIKWGDYRDFGKDFSNLTALGPRRNAKDYDRIAKQIAEERDGAEASRNSQG